MELRQTHNGFHIDWCAASFSLVVSDYKSSFVYSVLKNIMHKYEYFILDVEKIILKILNIIFSVRCLSFTKLFGIQIMATTRGYCLPLREVFQ